MLCSAVNKEMDLCHCKQRKSRGVLFTWHVRFPLCLHENSPVMTMNQPFAFRFTEAKSCHLSAEEEWRVETMSTHEMVILYVENHFAETQNKLFNPIKRREFKHSGPKIRQTQQAGFRQKSRSTFTGRSNTQTILIHRPNQDNLARNWEQDRV